MERKKKTGVYLDLPPLNVAILAYIALARLTSKVLMGFDAFREEILRIAVSHPAGTETDFLTIDRILGVQETGRVEEFFPVLLRQGAIGAKHYADEQRGSISGVSFQTDAHLLAVMAPVLTVGIGKIRTIGRPTDPISFWEPDPSEGTDKPLGMRSILLDDINRLVHRWGLQQSPLCCTVMGLALESVHGKLPDISIRLLPHPSVKSIQFPVTINFRDQSGNDIMRALISEVSETVRAQYKKLGLCGQPRGHTDPEIQERNLEWYFMRVSGLDIGQIITAYNKKTSGKVKIARRTKSQDTTLPKRSQPLQNMGDAGTPENMPSANGDCYKEGVRTLDTESRRDQALVKSGIADARDLLRWNSAGDRVSERTRNL